MADELRIIIGADIKDLEKELTKAKKDLDRFAKKVGGGAKGVDKLGKSTANATPALTEFSRVIQDAPFGIQGVANNITQLTSQFGNLSKSAGGSKAALKAMLSTLAGPAGILLAVSAVTSLLVAFGDKLFKTADAAETLRKKQEQLKQELDDYINALGAVAQATLKGEQAAQKELRTLEQLRKQAENTALSQEKRSAAVKELQKLYPSYLGNMDTEKILNGDLKGTYDDLTTSILKRARATAANNQIIKNSETLLTLESKLASEKAKLAESESKLADELEKVNTRRKTGAGAISGLNTVIADTRESINTLTGEIQSLELANIDLEGLVDGDGFAESTAKTIKEGRKKLKTLIDQDRFTITPFFNKEQLKTQENELKQGLAAQLQAYDLFRGQYLARQVEFEEALRAAQERAKQITEALTSAFTSLGQNIANALSQSSGIFGAFVGTIIQESLKLVSQLIANSIKGTAAIAAQTAKQIALNKAAATSGAIAAAAQTAAASGPGAAFLLPGLIAAAVAAIGAAFSGIGGGGASASVGGAGTASNTSAVNTTFSRTGGGEQRVVFELAGTKLLGVLQNTVNAGNRINGGAITLG